MTTDKPKPTLIERLLDAPLTPLGEELIRELRRLQLENDAFKSGRIGRKPGPPPWLPR